jgi:RNA polymerase sigma factor (sigma-70 family)
MMGVMALRIRSSHDTPRAMSHDAAASRDAASAQDTTFESRFVELYPRAFALAYRMLGNRAAAEDIAAETMARALLRWDRLDPDRVAGWVLKVTANQAIDLMRRKGRVLDAGVVDLEDSTTLRIALAEALRKLPRRQREAVTLRYLSDLSEADTAVALGISTGSVKTHVHRGLASLRADLGHDTLEEAVGARSH